jgi:threonine/homoserine/homoserine lactone efflux protein
MVERPSTFTIPLQTLAFFSLAVLALLVTPGPNMMFVLTGGAAHRWRCD